MSDFRIKGKKQGQLVEKTANAVNFWDLTVYDPLDFDEVREWMKEVAKQWVFQEEECPSTKKHHFQCRVNLKKKVRGCWMPDGWKGKASATSNDTLELAKKKGRQAFDYVMKDDTRIDGPWTDRDVGYVPSDVPKTMADLRGWQRDAIRHLLEQNDRRILFLVDKEGCSGKTKLIKFLMGRRNAIYVPPLQDTVNQIMGYFHDATILEPHRKRILVIDVPRATELSFWKKLAPAIEMMKDGFAVDGRNKSRYHMVEQPMVVVSLNGMPYDRKGNQAKLHWFFTPDKIDIWDKYSDEEPKQQPIEKYRVLDGLTPIVHETDAHSAGSCE